MAAVAHDHRSLEVVVMCEVQKEGFLVTDWLDYTNETHSPPN